MGLGRDVESGDHCLETSGHACGPYAQISQFADGPEIVDVVESMDCGLLRVSRVGSGFKCIQG